MKKRLRNLKIVQKLGLILSIIIVIFLIAIGSAIACMSAMGNEMSFFYHTPHEVVQTQLEIRRDLQKVGKFSLWAVATSDFTVIDACIEQVQRTEEEMQTSIDKLNQQFSDQALLEQMNGQYAQLSDALQELVRFASTNQRNSALKYYNETYNALSENLQSTLEHISEAAENQALEAYQSSVRLQTTAVLMMCLIFVASIAFAVFLAYSVAQSIVKPMKEVMQAAEQIVQGDLEVQLHIDSKDEIGALSKSFTHMAHALRNIIQDTCNYLDALAHRNFCIDIANEQIYVGTYQNLMLSMKEINQRLNQTLLDINLTSDKVAVGAEQMSFGAQALSQGATEQAAAVEELSATIQDISLQIQETADGSKLADNDNQQSAGELRHCDESMGQLVAAMQDISDSSHEIGRIIKTIDDIAFQTNILALNAAVEAARAGVAGKGFAVVADEVRNLAQKSAEAAKNTTTLIEAAIHAVSKGNQLAQNTAKSLNSSITISEKVANSVAKIAEASEQQANAIQQVTQGIQQISDVVQMNSATAEESAAASAELSGQAQMLKKEIGQFALYQHDISDENLQTEKPRDSLSETEDAEAFATYAEEESGKY